MIGSVSERRVDPLEKISITREEVLVFLGNNKTDKSPHPDGIHPKLFREARDEIAGPLTEVFVSSLDTGEVPGD